MRKYRAKMKQRKMNSKVQNEVTNNTSNKKVHKSRRKAFLQKKMAVKRTQEWRMRIKLKISADNSDQLENTSQDSSSAFKSRFAKSRKMKKVKSVLPCNPTKKAEVTKELVKSPSISKILTEQNAIISPVCRRKLEVADAVISSVQDSLEEVRETSSKDTQKQHAYKVVRAAIVKKDKKRSALVKKVLKMSYRSRQLKTEWWAKSNRRRRKDALNETIQLSVQNFYRSSEVSREVPFKKDVLKIKGPDGKKELVQKQIMTMTLEEAQRLYKVKYPDHKIGLTAFRKLKPENVRKVSETSRRTCLCQICCNVALKTEALKKHIKDVKTEENRKILETVIVDKKAMGDSTFCQYENRPAAKCLTRKCENCSTENLDLYLEPISCQSKDKKMTWYQWGLTEIIKGDQVKKCVACLPKEGSYEEFLKVLKEDFTEYPEHNYI